MFQRFNAVYTTYFKDPRPTRTTVVVAKLVGPGHIEITTTARKSAETMSLKRPRPPDSLEAKSPFELRVNLGKGVPESDVRSALATGDMGFLHSFTTGSTVDGPGVRVVAWTTGCMWRCLYCHNPDTWTMSNGMPVTVAKAAEELRYRHG